MLTKLSQGWATKENIFINFEQWNEVDFFVPYQNINKVVNFALVDN